MDICLIPVPPPAQIQHAHPHLPLYCIRIRVSSACSPLLPGGLDLFVMGGARFLVLCVRPSVGSTRRSPPTSAVLVHSLDGNHLTLSVSEGAQ